MGAVRTYDNLITTSLIPQSIAAQSLGGGGPRYRIRYLEVVGRMVTLRLRRWSRDHSTRTNYVRLLDGQ